MPASANDPVALTWRSRAPRPTGCSQREPVRSLKAWGLGAADLEMRQDGRPYISDAIAPARWPQAVGAMRAGVSG